ncbi:pecanex-like 4 [Perkinsus olseni]|uniref:Pecanex-like 4 n=1 Tax=Perkinsus olseni TaxID=32597 RepID=A0A7J6LA99_PEROL|nr:pecanex-like 4 [Perkinsus olseni]
MSSNEAYAGHLLDDGRGLFVLRRFVWSTVLGGLRPPPCGRWWALASAIQLVVCLVPLGGLLVARGLASGAGEWELAAIFGVWGVVSTLLSIAVGKIARSRKVPSSIPGSQIFWNDYDTNEEVNTLSAAVRWGLGVASSKPSLFVRPLVAGINFGLLVWASSRGYAYFLLSAIAVATVGGFSLITGLAPFELAPMVSHTVLDPTLSRSLTLLPLLIAGCAAIKASHEGVATAIYLVVAVCPLLWAVGLLPRFEDACLWLVEFVSYHFCGTTNPVPIVPLTIVAVLALALPETHLLLYSIIGVLVGLIPPFLPCQLRAVVRQVVVCSAGVGLGFALRQVENSSPTRWWIALSLGLAECVILQFKVASRFLVAAFARLSLLVSLVYLLAYHEAVSEWYVTWLSVRHFTSATAGMRRFPLGLPVTVVAAFHLVWYDDEDPEALPQAAVLLMAADFVVQKTFSVTKGFHFGLALMYYSFRAPKQRHRGREVFAGLSTVLLPLSCFFSNDNTPLPLFTAPLFVFRQWLPTSSNFYRGGDKMMTTGLQGSLCRALMVHGGLVEATRRLFRDPGNDLLLFRAPEESLLFVGRVLKRWYGGCIIEFRFSELADQTSCHQTEARAVDAAFAGERRVWAMRPIDSKVAVGHYEYSRLSLAGVITSEECLRAIWKRFGMVLLVMVKRLEDTLEVEVEDILHEYETAVGYFPHQLADCLGILTTPPVDRRVCDRPTGVRGAFEPTEVSERSVGEDDDVDALLQDVLLYATKSTSNVAEGAESAEGPDWAPLRRGKAGRTWLRLFSQKASLVDRFGADPALGGPGLIARAWKESGDTLAGGLSSEAFRRGCALGLETFVTTGQDDISIESAIEVVDDCTTYSRFIGDVSGAGWEEAMAKKAPSLFSLVIEPSGSIGGVIRLTWREATRSNVNVARLNTVSFDAIASASELDLKYFASNDEERYSIQQHEEMLRNLTVQLTEYPVCVSGPLHVSYDV